MVTLYPLEELVPGTYIFTVLANDPYGNMGTQTNETIVTQLSALSISLVAPTFGVAQARTYDFHVVTNRKANCRYKSTYGTYDSMGSLFSEKDTHTVDHTINNFDYTGIIYVGCKDKYGHEAVEEFSLSYDLTDPTITSLTASRPTIYENPIESTITAQLSEPTVCRYSKSSTNWNDMISFSETNESNLGDYTT